VSARFSTIYLGWKRGADVTSPDLGSAERRLYRGKGGYGATTILPRVMFLLWVARQLLKIRPTSVVVVNEELVPALSVVRVLFPFRLIVDIHDPIADRVVLRFGGFLLKGLQRLARSVADCLWVTDESRFANLSLHHQKKAIVIPNYPNRLAFEPGLVDRDGTNDDVVVAVVGSLHSDRGLRVLSAAMRSVGGCRAEVAGWATDDFGREFCEYPFVRFHGIVNLQESLRIMAGCDVIFCFYNPDIPNNRNASPNKVYEAICIGKMCVINAEAKVSDWVAANEFGYVCAYADSGALADILRRVKRERSKHRIPNERLIQFAESRLYWEVSEKALVASLP
jgi:glycosyltransferase involved in cell wall biosynthesis